MLVEAALVLPVLFIFVFGVIDFGRVYQLRNQLSGAAQEGAAYAQSFPLRVSGCADGGRDITSVTASELSDFPGGTSVTVTVAKVTAGGTTAVTGCTTTAPTPGDRFIVSVTATFRTYTPVISRIVGATKPITRSEQVVYQG